MPSPRFFLLAVDETLHWGPATLARYQIIAAFGVYAIRHGEATHVCSLTPSSYAYPVSNEFIHEPTFEPNSDEDHELYDLSQSYLDHTYLPYTRYDRHSLFQSRLFQADDHEDAATNCPPIHKIRILQLPTFRAYQRAQNLPLPSNHPEYLPWMPSSPT